MSCFCYIIYHCVSKTALTDNKLQIWAQECSINIHCKIRATACTNDLCFVADTDSSMANLLENFHGGWVGYNLDWNSVECTKL